LKRSNHEPAKQLLTTHTIFNFSHNDVFTTFVLA